MSFQKIVHYGVHICAKSRNISGKISRKFKNGLERPWKASQGPLRHWECSGRLQNLIFRFLWCSTHCNRVLESAKISGKISGKNFPKYFGVWVLGIMIWKNTAYTHHVGYHRNRVVVPVNFFQFFGRFDLTRCPGTLAKGSPQPPQNKLFSNKMNHGMWGIIGTVSSWQ